MAGHRAAASDHPSLRRRRRSCRRSFRREKRAFALKGREEREKEKGKRRKIGSTTLIYPLLTRPVFFLNRPSSRPNTFSAFISAQLPLVFFSCLLHPPLLHSLFFFFSHFAYFFHAFFFHILFCCISYLFSSLFFAFRFNFKHS